MGHARLERVLLVGTRSADYIRASGHSGRIQRPYTWLHPTRSLKCQIPLAPRAPSIHDPTETWGLKTFVAQKHRSFFALGRDIVPFYWHANELLREGFAWQSTSDGENSY